MNISLEFQTAIEDIVEKIRLYFLKNCSKRSVKKYIICIKSTAFYADIKIDERGLTKIRLKKDMATTSVVKVLTLTTTF